MRKLLTFVLLSIIVYGCSSDDNVISSLCFEKEYYEKPLLENSAHPTNPVECCADANPKTMLPNDT